jgi:hypothetical protein
MSRSRNRSKILIPWTTPLPKMKAETNRMTMGEMMGEINQKAMTHEEVLDLLKSRNLTTLDLIKVRIAIRMMSRLLTRKRSRLAKMELRVREALATAKTTMEVDAIHKAYRMTADHEMMVKELENEEANLIRFQKQLKLATVSRRM